MAIRKIVQIGDKTLRKVSAPVEDINCEIIQLLEDMKQTLALADGVGLAAPQVGVNSRIFIISLEEGYFEFINPKITKKSGCQVGAEGCLSVVGKQGTVERPNKVVVTAFDRNGKQFTITCYGLFARAVCHENDHLDGVLYVDKATDIVEV